MAITTPPVVKKINPGSIKRIVFNWNDRWLPSHSLSLTSVAYTVPTGLTKVKDSTDVVNGKSSLWVRSTDGTTEETYRVVAVASTDDTDTNAISVDVEVTSDV